MNLFDKYPSLENKRIFLKRMELKDAINLEKMLKEKEVYQLEPTYLPELLSKDAKTFISFDVDSLFKEKSCILLGIYLKESPTELMGIAEIYDYVEARNKASIGYRLEKGCWRKRIGTSVVSLLKDYLLNEVGIARITAHVRVENAASENCLLNNGFTQRRSAHEEDWGFQSPILANKYVIYLKGEEVLD